MINSINAADIVAISETCHGPTESFLVKDYKLFSYPPRQILDKTINKHGESFLEFLRNANSFVVNGRVTPDFYTTALKGLLGYCFHPWCPDGRASWLAGGWQEKVCSGCISETVRCRKLILGRDIG